MASSTNDEEFGWGLIDAADFTVGGWSTLVFEAAQHHALCECCLELNIGCLCEETMLYYQMHLAQQAYQKARKEYWAWFDEHRRPAIEFEDAVWDLRKRREQRRWRQFHGRRMRAFYKRMAREAEAKRKEEEQAKREEERAAIAAIEKRLKGDDEDDKEN